MSFTTTVNDLPLGLGVRVLEHNADGLVALEKPAGLMVHPNKPKDRKYSMLDADYDYEQEFFSWEMDGQRKRIWLINRIDSPTSGVVLLALNEELAVIVKQQFATHRVNKIYYALVKNALRTNGGTWSDNLRKDVYRGGRLIPKGQSVPAKASYQMVKTPTGGFPVALLKLVPVTGRTHQLRVQCQKHGHPIVGDRTYGSFSFNREVRAETGVKRMLLHSAETSLKYAFRGKLGEFRAKSALPEEFNEVMRFRPGLYQSSKNPRRTAAPFEASEVSTSDSLKGRRFKGV